MIEFLMPSLGADMEAGTLREWMVKPGDMVKRGDIIAVVETQKGLIEIEVFNDGKIEKLLIREDEKVPVGTIMALINPVEKGENAKAEIKKETAGEVKEQSVVKKEVSPVQKEIRKADERAKQKRIKITPLARKIAEEKKIDINLLQGTGEEGEITRKDVENFAGKATGQAEEKTFATNDAIRNAIASAMSRSNREIPHYYLEMKIDMSKALTWLKETNKARSVKDRILPVAMIIKAIAKSLIEVPELNATWNERLQPKEEINIGFVISLRTGGLMIPAITGADLKSVDEIMQSLNDIIPRARKMRLKSSELSNTTITYSNLGDEGAEELFGVIYPPQVAIVGTGSIREQPWAENGMIAVRPVMSVTLAGDHRATDGHTGNRFLILLNRHLQNPESL